MKNGVDSTKLRPDRPGPDGTRETDLLWLYLKSVPAFRALLRAVESRFYQYIELPEPVLDLGCGDGLFAELTFDTKLAAGIDPWWGPLLKAERSAAYNTVSQSFGHELPFADGHFASAISNSVLEHISDLQPVLYEIHRVLQDDGRFVVTMPSHYFTANLGGALALEKVRLKPLADGYRSAFNRMARHAHVDPPEKWAARFADAGFSVARWQYYFSTKALHALEIGHLQGLPSAIIHAITGHWILAPWESNLRITERWVRPFYEEKPPSPGTMILFVLRKSANRPISLSLPDPNPIDLAERELDLSVPISTTEEPIIDHPDLSLVDTSPADLEVGIEHHPEMETARRKTLSWRLPRGWLGATLILLSIVAAFIGINTLRSGESKPLQTILWFIISAASLLVAGYPELLSSARLNMTKGIKGAPRRRWLVLVSLWFAFLAYQIAKNPSAEKRAFVALGFWLLAILIAGFALLDSRRKRFKTRPFRYPLRSWEILAIVAIFIAALAIRLVDITSHPFILSGSEASIGLDAWAVATSKIQSPFASAWLTNPTMPLYLLAVPISILGRTVMAIRVLSPFIGALTVVVLYLFGRRLWGPAVGLIAALLLAGSHVHIHYSRLGMTNVWDPLLVTAAIGLLYVAWQERNRKLWIIAGIVTGLNAYVYTASHILPIILLGLFIYLLRDWRELWEQRSNIFAASVMVLIVSFPQFLYYRLNTTIFFDRVNALGIIQSGWLLQESDLTGLSPFEVIIRQFWSGLLSFQAGLDNSTAYNPGVSILGFWPAALFVLGVGMAIWRFRQLRFAILLIWTGVTLIFAGALLESPPNSHRLLIAIPAVYLLVSLAAFWLVYQVLRLLKVSRRYVIPVVLSIAVLIAMSDLFFYFGDYRDQTRYGDRNTEVASEVSVYLDSLEGQWLVYFYGAPSMYSSFPTFAYLVEDFGTDIHIIDVEEPGSVPPAMPGTNVVYVFLPERLEELEQVQELFQNGELKVLSGYHANPLSYIYQIQG
ncbi:MAG: glycosyltransferase family 39 protein [Candidatus Promineifilaceae bacterium]